jgi:hypothetical protein
MWSSFAKRTRPRVPGKRESPASAGAVRADGENVAKPKIFEAARATVSFAVDHDTVVHDAASLCSTNGVKSIIVPHVRVEQSGYSGRSHASFATTLVSCDGVPLAHGANDADMPGGGWNNFTASATGIFERAVTPALDALYPATKPMTAATPQPSPSP